MYLNSTADINAVVNWVNDYGAGMIAPEVFYSKQLLDTIRLDANEYSYYRYADEMPIQDKADKLTVRRWAPLRAHTVPLQEGVPPVSDKGSVEKYEMEADQYGRYMEFTDKVDFKVVDPVVCISVPSERPIQLRCVSLMESDQSMVSRPSSRRCA